MSIRLRYELKNGDTVRRDYTIACVSGTETYRLTNQLLNMPQFRRSAMGIDWLETSGWTPSAAATWRTTGPAPRWI